MKQALTALALVALLTLSLPAMVGLGAASSTNTSSNSSLTTIDDDHPVATEDGVDEFQADGFTSGHTGDIDLEITVAESSADVGVDSMFETDFNGVFLRTEYNETIDRSVRFYVPKEMWHPHRMEGEDAITGDAEADFDIADDGNYTAVTVHFDGETDSVFRISKEAATIFELRSQSTSFVENVTGYEMPTVIGSTDWQYPDDTFDGNNSTAAFEHSGELTVEYDSDDTPGRERWVNVPSCDSSAGSDAAVCSFERDGVENTTYVTARTADAPDIRYTDDRSWLDGVRSTVYNDLRAAYDDFRGTLEAYTPGLMIPIATREVTPW